jgi:hypothetical protein
MRKSGTLPSEYFEEKYQADIDPWRFKTSEYERDKYQATLGSLTKDRYPAAPARGEARSGVMAASGTRKTPAHGASGNINGPR